MGVVWPILFPLFLALSVFARRVRCVDMRRHGLAPINYAFARTQTWEASRTNG